MAKGAKIFSTAVGKKVAMALTGLGLCIYLVLHLAGNLLLLTGSTQFNAYAHTLTAIPILPLIELGLLAIFLIHIYEAIKVSLENRNARPVGYQTKVWARTKSQKSVKSVSSTTMMWSGIIILVFVALHVWHFKYGKFYAVQPANVAVGTANTGVATSSTNPQEAQEQVRDLAYLVISEFKKPLIVALYVASMIVLGMHLFHAFSSAFQSLGVSNPRYRSILLRTGQIFTIVIAGGFAFLPVWVYLMFPTPPPRNIAGPDNGMAVVPLTHPRLTHTRLSQSHVLRGGHQ
ncbi:MAG: succinate dehydrogenase cytochrome b subunit [Abitibacteriaceae bacterium]|nr:succinate dehydrogenase cytochrome b subunit [Abditibacteriaceae bacterium]